MNAKILGILVIGVMVIACMTFVVSGWGDWRSSTGYSSYYGDDYDSDDDDSSSGGHTCPGCGCECHGCGGCLTDSIDLVKTVELLHPLVDL